MLGEIPGIDFDNLPGEHLILVGIPGTECNGTVRKKVGESVNNAPRRKNGVYGFSSAPCLKNQCCHFGHTQQLRNLFFVPRENRDSAWVEKFQLFAWSAAVIVPKEGPFRGPDGFPYIRLDIPSSKSSAETKCLAHICSSLAEQGFGATFFASAKDDMDEAQYVISNGVLESLRAYGTWNGDPTDRAEIRKRPKSVSADGLETSFVEQDGNIFIGDPAPRFLPAHTARFLHWHLCQGLKIEEPRIKMLIDEELAPSRNLVINKKFSEFPDSETAAAKTRILTWYLPPRRGLILMPEDWTQNQMTPLKEFFAPIPA